MLSQHTQQPDNVLFAAPKTIPFDYVFQLPLKGERGNKVQDVVEISAEGNFIALSIGYSLVADDRRLFRASEERISATTLNARLSPNSFQATINPTTTPQSPVMIPCFLRENNSYIFHGIIVAGMPGAEIAIVNYNAKLVGSQLPPSVEKSRATLGADGKIKIALPPTNDAMLLQAWDKTNNLVSRFFVAVPNFGMTPTVGPRDFSVASLPVAGDEAIFVYGRPNDQVNVAVVNFASAEGPVAPFIVNSSLTAVAVQVRDAESENLSEVFIGTTNGRKNNQTKLAPGDTFLVWPTGNYGFAFSSTFSIPRPKANTITLQAIAAGLERIGADLTQGFRLNPQFAQFADLPFDQLTSETVENIFEAGSFTTAETSFLYSLDVSSSGRDYQSKPIHNIAGLGAANGVRPFRPFAKPVLFEPRSSLRLQVEEITGPPGTLHIVLQGYKVLSAGRIAR